MKPDCRKCGLCCIANYDQEAFADVTIEDVERLNRRWAKKNILYPRTIDLLAAVIDSTSLVHGAVRTRWVTSKTGPLKGTEACACVALQGSIGYRVRCTIYNRRPEVCRKAVKPGDRICKAIRKEILGLSDSKRNTP